MYETHATLLFILNHLYSSDPYKIQTSYTLIQCQLKNKKIIGISSLKKSIFWPRKTCSWQKIGLESLF